MNQTEFDNIVRSTPVKLAVFKMIRTPNWQYYKDRGKDLGFKVGDEYAYYNGSMIRVSDGHSFGLAPSYLKFIEYRDASTFSWYGKIGRPVYV